MFFRKKPTVDADEEAWVLAAWRWLDDVMEPVAGDDVLWLPRPDHFPPTQLSGHAAAQHTFDLVKGKCGMATWPTRLVAQRERPQLAASAAHDAIFVNDPGGTFRMDGDTAVITYDPALVAMRHHMVFTFAHELSHYAQIAADDAPPGGEDCMELVTDLGAAHMGFGFFGATCVVKSYKSAFAYMPEHMWYFATAIFCELTSTPPTHYEKHASDWVRSGIRQNRRYLQANPSLLRSRLGPRRLDRVKT